MKEEAQKVFLQWRRTKIIATIGPATDSERMIKKMVHSGVDAFRLNMSHGNHQQHQETFEHIRKVTADMGRHLPILMDLCGPKLRVGRFKSGQITLKRNSKITITCRKVTGDGRLIPSQVKNLYKDVKISERVLLDDGNMELCIEGIKDKDILCKVIHGGILKDNKGINLPDTAISISSPTAKDKRDVKLAMQLGADFVALSFVRSAKDVRTLKRFMTRAGHGIPVIAKIERPEAVENAESIKNILEVSDGIMVARGDLGIELPAEKVPLIQKKLITLARYYHRPVIVATQMMESMIAHSRPTRAEVADVANAALNSTDAVMLSAETAVGSYPAATVKHMDRILREIELHQWQEDDFSTIRELNLDIVKDTSPRQAVARAACSLARELKTQGVIVPTSNGTTAQVLSANRPASPLVGVSPDAAICRKLALHWGIIPLEVEEKETHDWKLLCKAVARRFKLTRTGNTVLLVSGFNKDPEYNEPVIKIMKV